MNDAAVVATERLTKRFDLVLADDRLDLVVDQGEVFGYLGPGGPRLGAVPLEDDRRTTDPHRSRNNAVDDRSNELPSTTMVGV